MICEMAVVRCDYIINMMMISMNMVMHQMMAGMWTRTMIKPYLWMTIKKL